MGTEVWGEAWTTMLTFLFDLGQLDAGLPPEALGAERQKIGKVTAKDVEEAGSKYFPAARQTIVAVGEEKVIEQQLAPFGLPLRPAPKP